MKAIKEIERLVGMFCAADKSSTCTSPQMDQRVLADALRAGQKPTTSKPAWAGTNIRRMIMKSPLTRLAIAAAVLIVCGTGLSLWRTTSSGIALADVLARVEKVKTVRFKSLLKLVSDGSDDPNNRWGAEYLTTVLTSQEYGSRISYEDDPNGRHFGEIYYFLPQKRTRIEIKPKQKRYTRMELDDAQVEQMQKYGNQYVDASVLLKEIMRCKYKGLGKTTIDGNEAEVFQITDPNYYAKEIKNPKTKNPPQVDVKIWVDVKTRLPVRYEEFTSALTDMSGNRMSQQHVLYDFQWDVPVDASEFEPVIPDGYTSVVAKFPAHITEETAIQGLKLFVELLGKYPERIALSYLWSGVEKSETPAALRLKEGIKGLTDEEKQNKLVDFLIPIRGLARFYLLLPQDEKDRAYYGETVTPKDADKVLLRWKVSDHEYRVIYGDLHAETVSPEKLAELEKTRPK